MKKLNHDKKLLTEKYKIINIIEKENNIFLRSESNTILVFRALLLLFQVIDIPYFQSLLRKNSIYINMHYRHL